MTQNLWDSAKAVLKGKFIAIWSYVKKQEKHQIDKLTLHQEHWEKNKKPQSQQREVNHKDQSRNKWKRMKETIAKIDKTKSWFFEKTSKIDKPLARFIKKKREKNQINRIRTEKWDVTTDNTEIQRIIREYYEQLYAGKTDSLEEMNRYLEKISLPRLNQEEIEIMNKPIGSIEIKTVIKNLPR